MSVTGALSDDSIISTDDIAITPDDTNITQKEEGGFLHNLFVKIFQGIANMFIEKFPEMKLNSTLEPPIVLLPQNISQHEKFKIFDEEKSQQLSWDIDNNDIEYPKKLPIGRDENHIGYPKRIRIRRGADYGDEMLSYDDYDDETGGCTPKQLKTAEVKCIKWPSFIVCFSYCIFGHTYPEGIMRENNCKLDPNKQGRWSSPFEECKPFVDCTLKMTKPGELKCISNEMMKKPTCDVTCESFEKNEKINQKIRCDSEGKWEPMKPFCVDKKGIDIVPAPKQKEHGKLNFPKKKPNL